MKSDVHKLQHYLSTHIGTINILLTEYQLDLLSLASEQASSDKQDIQSHLRTIQGAIDATTATALVDKQDIDSHLQTIRDEIKAAAAQHSRNTQDIEYHLQDLQAAVNATTSNVIDVKANIEHSTIALRHNTSLVQELLGIVQGDFKPFCMSLINTLGNVRTTTAQIHTIVLEIRSTLTRPDLRFSSFQIPVKVEDALGRIFPVPSEYTFSDLECIIQMKFANSPGHEEVIAGNYELSNRKNSKHILTGEDTIVLLPGMSIIMAIVVDQVPVSSSTCTKCGSTDTAAVEGSGRKLYAPSILH